MDTLTEEEALDFYNSINLGDLEGEKHPQGWLFQKLNKFGSISKAGLFAGDVLTAVDGHSVVDIRWPAYMTILKEAGVGNTVKFDVLRAGQPMSFNVKLKQRKTLAFNIGEADHDLRKIVPA